LSGFVRQGEHKEKDDDKGGRENELCCRPFPVVEGRESPDQDEEQEREGGMKQNEDGIFNSDPVCHQEEDPRTCLERDKDFAGKHPAPDHLGKGDERGVQRLMLVLPGDGIDDECRRDDPRQEDQERDQKPVHEFEEIPAAGGRVKRIESRYPSLEEMLVAVGK